MESIESIESIELLIHRIHRLAGPYNPVNQPSHGANVRAILNSMVRNLDFIARKLDPMGHHVGFYGFDRIRILFAIELISLKIESKPSSSDAYSVS